MKSHRTQESAGDVSWAIQVIEYKMQVGKIALGRSSSYDCGYVKSKSVLIKILVIAVK